MKSVKLWEYLIQEDGTIYNKNGKKINHYKQIKINWGEEKKPRYVSYARFVYYAFNYNNFNFDDKTIIIRHKNKNKEDCNINNLIAMNRKFISQGEYSSLSKLTNKDVEDIKKIYELNKEKGIKNNDPTTKISYRKLANKYGVSHTLIENIINGSARNEEKYIIK